jgi:hypothetical protein
MGGAGYVFTGQWKSGDIRPHRVACARPHQICGPMRYVIALLALLICLAAQGCAPNSEPKAPDYILSPRG